MVVAPTVADGIATAVALARAVSAQPSFPALRVGLHVGTAVERDNDYFGATVNLAARVAGIARAGEIVCMEAVAAVASEESLASARPMGTVRLKNVATPVTLYELHTGERGGELRYNDPVCRMQVVAENASMQREHAGATIYFCSDACAAKFDDAPESHLPLATEKPLA